MISKAGLSESLGSGSFTNYFTTLYYANSPTIIQNTSSNYYSITCNDNDVRIDSEVKGSSSAATSHKTVTTYAGKMFLYNDPFSVRSGYTPTAISSYQNSISNGAPSYIYLFEIKSFESIVGSNDIKCNYSDSYNLDPSNYTDGVTWEYDCTLTSENRNAYTEGVYSNYKIEYIGAE